MPLTNPWKQFHRDPNEVWEPSKPKLVGKACACCGKQLTSDETASAIALASDFCTDHMINGICHGCLSIMYKGMGRPGTGAAILKLFKEMEQEDAITKSKEVRE